MKLNPGYALEFCNEGLTWIKVLIIRLVLFSYHKLPFILIFYRNSIKSELENNTGLILYI